MTLRYGSTFIPAVFQAFLLLAFLEEPVGRKNR